MEQKGKYVEVCTYEDIYYTIWELGERYRGFTEFRVIGQSHDGRYIPMLEIGRGEQTIFCVTGLDGTERRLPRLMVQLMKEYCYAYESGWLLEEFYDVREILDKVRVSIIPLLNPDGYEIGTRGWMGIRNPVYRQMLKMKEIPWEEYAGNARGVNLSENFPSLKYKRKQIGNEPGSENEVKALIRILQEYESRGFLLFSWEERTGISYVHSRNGFADRKIRSIARHMRKQMYGRGQSPCRSLTENPDVRKEASGSPQEYYTERIKKMSLEIECSSFRDLIILPLEYIFSIVA